MNALLLWGWLACTGEPSPASSPPETSATDQLPWSIVQRADGATEVFGLSPGRSTLQEVRARFPAAAPDVAMFEDVSGELSIEAYFSEVTVSRLVGRLIVRLDAPAPLRASIQQRSKREPVGTGTFRYALPPGTEAVLDALVVSGITYAPAARLDEALVVSRFGSPSERHAIEAEGVVLLYPERGVGVVLNPKGREQIQYVHPTAFGDLRERLGISDRGGADILPP